LYAYYLQVLSSSGRCPPLIGQGLLQRVITVVVVIRLLGSGKAGLDWQHALIRTAAHFVVMYAALLSPTKSRIISDTDGGGLISTNPAALGNCFCCWA